MSDTSMSAVGQLNAISLQQGGSPPKTETPKPTARTITWTLKPVWTVGEVIAATDITVSAGPANAAQTTPTAVAQTKGGITIAVTAVAPAAEGFAEATKTETVTVAKIKPTIVWKTPLPVKTGTKLSSKQQDATVTPTGLALVYDPADGTAMATAGDADLEGRVAGDDGHEAASETVKLMVVADDTALADATGKIGMESGRAHAFRTEARVTETLDKWNKSDPKDPLSMKVQGQKIMADIKGKKPQELIDYMDALIKDGKGDFNFANLNSNGNPATYPNKIWILPNGLQVRFKPFGDGQDGLTDPMFCVEGRCSDVSSFGGEPTDSAFKLMANGEPAPIGPSDTVKNPFGTDTDLNEKYMSATCKMTHMYCPAEEQEVAWAGVQTTNLAAKKVPEAKLNATAHKKGDTKTATGATMTYWDKTKSKKNNDIEQPLTKDTALTAGKPHALFAKAMPVGNYKSAQSAKFNVTP